MAAEVQNRDRILHGNQRAEKWAEHVKPIITPYALKDIFNLDETAHFIIYNIRRIWHEGKEVSGRKGV
jgi:hypothetical protein